MKTMSGNDEFQVKHSVTKNVLFVVLGAALILLVPLVAMQFTDEMAWDLADFVLAGALLVGTGLTYVMLARKLSNTRHRAIVGVVFALALFLVWVELAVGIIGD